MRRNADSGELVGTLADGDLGWRGVNARLHASELPAGWASKAINMRFSDLKPQSRLGKCPVVWMNKVTGGQQGPWGTIYGRGAFLDPVTSTRFHLMAADGNVYYSRANNPTTQLALPAGQTVTGECEFYQCFDVVILARGEAGDPLVMTSISEGFKAITPAAEGTGLLTIPRFLVGLPFGNRFYVVRYGTDEVLASDVQDYTHYTQFDDLRINQGEADRIVALAPFGNATIVTLKEGRVYKTENVTGDLSLIVTDLVTDRYGCLSRKSVARGDDLFWWSQEGVASLTLTELNEIQARANPSHQWTMLSDDIQPLVERVNGNFSAGIQGVVHRKRLYVAAPLDGAETFGPELMGSGMSYDPNAGPGIVLILEQNKRYRWKPGTEVAAATADTTNGFVALGGQTDFVAYHGSGFPSFQVLASGTVCGSSLERVFAGVNNAVLVYNFTNEGWEGYDWTIGPEGREVKFLFTFPYNGGDRLFFAGPDGWVNLFEETFEDVLSRPYVDIEVASLPQVGNSIQINGGTVATAINSAMNNGPAHQWGCDTLAHARANLFWPYAAGAGAGWTRPNTVAVPITNGMRVYGTNGAVPVVTLSGVFATLTYRTRQGIATDFVSRGYGSVEKPLEVKRGRELVAILETWAPKYTLGVIAEGVGRETTFVTAETRDRTVFDQWDAAPFQEDNRDDNFEAAGRQDYSLVLATNTSQVDLQDGIRLDLHQEVKRKVHTPARARAAQVRVQNSEGRIRIMGIGYKGFEVEKNREGARR